MHLGTFSFLDRVEGGWGEVGVALASPYPVNGFGLAALEVGIQLKGLAADLGFRVDLEFRGGEGEGGVILRLGGG